MKESLQANMVRTTNEALAYLQENTKKMNSVKWTLDHCSREVRNNTASDQEQEKVRAASNVVEGKRHYIYALESEIGFWRKKNGVAGGCPGYDELEGH